MVEVVDVVMTTNESTIFRCQRVRARRGSGVRVRRVTLLCNGHNGSIGGEGEYRSIGVKEYKRIPLSHRSATFQLCAASAVRPPRA